MDRRDFDRALTITQALEQNGLDAVICSHPHNVLLLTGYWPVTGESVALFLRDGRVIVFAPADEQDLVNCGWPDDTHFISHSPDNRWEALKGVLSGMDFKRVGIEGDEEFVPAPYVALCLNARALYGVLSRTLPRTELVPFKSELAQLRAIPTRTERSRIVAACAAARKGFESAAGSIVSDATEVDVANAFRSAIERESGLAAEQRFGASVFCMSGPNSAEAYAAFQRTRMTAIEKNSPVLVHCNSFIDGFWTDITRSYVSGIPPPRLMQMLDAILFASDAAVALIRPGLRAADVNAGVRTALKSRGFLAEIKHSAGHGVGFSAIDHRANPVLDQSSSDVLAAGMIFNIEPGLYEPGYGGVRHCNMVLVTRNGCEVLTPFQDSVDQLIIHEIHTQA